MRTLACAIALALIASTGAIHGLWTGRWSASRALDDRVEALKLVPRGIGDWEGRDLPADARTMERAEIAGHLLRRYENRRDGGAVMVLLVCGRPGPISVHTPEVCYRGVGYEPSGPRVRRLIAGGGPEPDAVWALDLSRPGPASQERLRILYGWSVDGTWKPSESPRRDFAGAPALLKMYIVRTPAGPDESVQDDPGDRFLRQFLPALRASVFAKP